MLNFELDTIDEKHEAAAVRITHYKQQAVRYYNKNVHTRTFQVGDWVLRKVFQNTREIGAGKLGPNWERNNSGCRQRGLQVTNSRWNSHQQQLEHYTSSLILCLNNLYSIPFLLISFIFST